MKMAFIWALQDRSWEAACDLKTQKSPEGHHVVVFSDSLCGVQQAPCCVTSFFFPCQADLESNSTRCMLRLKLFLCVSVSIRQGQIFGKPVSLSYLKSLSTL